MLIKGDPCVYLYFVSCTSFHLKDGFEGEWIHILYLRLWWSSQIYNGNPYINKTLSSLGIEAESLGWEAMKLTYCWYTLGNGNKLQWNSNKIRNHCKVSQNLEATRFVFRIAPSLRNLTGPSAASMPERQSNIKAILWFILPTFMRSYDKTCYRILKRDPGCRTEVKVKLYSSRQLVDLFTKLHYISEYIKYK